MCIFLPFMSRVSLPVVDNTGGSRISLLWRDGATQPQTSVTGKGIKRMNHTLTIHMQSSFFLY